MSNTEEITIIVAIMIVAIPFLVYWFWSLRHGISKTAIDPQNKPSNKSNV